MLPPEIGPTAALVSLDAHTGAVLAMIGGRNYHASQFNLATQGERQPGSSFKPFVLAAALESGISPSTTLVSRPVTIDAGGRLWNVNNYEGDYNGTIDLRQAIAYSDNSVFAQLTNVVGPQRVADAAKELGIGTPLQPYFAIGLGAEPATPLDMARAYAGFANGGYRIDGAIFGNEPRVVECLEDADGDCRKDNSIDAHRVLEDWQAATIDELLQGVVTYGTGKAARIAGYPVAGKTGTTENYGDAWFVGLHAGHRDGGLGRLSGRASPDADRVSRPPGRRRHLSGADLEGLHGAGPAVPEPGFELVPAAVSPVLLIGDASSAATRRSSATTATAPARHRAALLDGAARPRVLRTQLGRRPRNGRLRNFEPARP